MDEHEMEKIADGHIALVRLEERERCAKIAETFPDDILVFVDRPGGPPGNYYRKATKSDIADAIRLGRKPG